MQKNKIHFFKTLPDAPARIFLIGIGGIGMSALAQLLLWKGYQIAGSDRDLKNQDKKELYQKLQKLGIELYPQDGSGITHFQPNAVIITAAIEPGNPDLPSDTKVCPVLHRACALSQLLDSIPATLITIAGSCGKTSVSGWIASALKSLKKPILMVNGGYSLDFISKNLPGNFYADPQPEYIIAEVDESDHSIKEFRPDYALLLNIGKDHYERTELENVFQQYLHHAKKGVVVPAELQTLAPQKIPQKTFTDKPHVQAPCPANYKCSQNGIHFQLPNLASIRSSQSGFHSAMNATAVFQLLRLLFPAEDKQNLADALCHYQGIRQRFEIMSSPKSCPVINDYAHNPQKIQAAIQTAKERFGTGIVLVFQPHGYGPFGFMREALKATLLHCLDKTDRFLLLPVFYAGGTSSFTPKSEEVAQEFAQDGLPVRAISERTEAAQFIYNFTPKSAVLIMGARDASLRAWTAEIATHIQYQESLC
ncbi:MAG: Mur ligase domain-containing protein [Lentisphaeria bacterium]